MTKDRNGYNGSLKKVVLLENLTNFWRYHFNLAFNILDDTVVDFGKYSLTLKFIHDSYLFVREFKQSENSQKDNEALNEPSWKQYGQDGN